MNEIHPNARRVQQALDQLKLPCQVVELPSSTRTAVDAANALNCSLGQIVKSLIFITCQTKQPVLIIASGLNRVNTSLIAEQVNESIEKADAEFVKQSSGYPIGGVPPVGLAHSMVTFIDEDLYQYDKIWAAAGTPNAVFELDPKNLVKMCGGNVIKVKQ